MNVWYDDYNKLVSRHCIIMELVNGYTLQNISEVGDPGGLSYSVLIFIKLKSSSFKQNSRLTNI